MTDPNCRIGKVTLKGGAELKIFESRADRMSQQIAADIIGNAVEIADISEPMGGYAILAWNLKGEKTICWRNHPNGAYSREEMPALLEAWLRTSIATDLMESVRDLDNDFDGAS